MNRYYLPIILILIVIVVLYAFGIVRPLRSETVQSLAKVTENVNGPREIFIPLIVGFVSSAAASLVYFWLFATFLRPSIAISPKISRTKHVNRGNEKTEYQFMIRNDSRGEAINIRAELHLLAQVGAPGGIRAKATEIKLVRTDPMTLAPKDKDNPMSSALFITSENLDRKWNADHQYLRLLVHATHASSNLPKTFDFEYYKKTIDIEDGEFKVGTEFEIITSNVIAQQAPPADAPKARAAEA